jgi:hypothetical protein
MIDLYMFYDFLSSLSKVYPLLFDLRDSEGAILFSGDNNGSPTVSKELSMLSERIIREESFQHQRVPEKYDLFGVPIWDNVKLVGVLSAYANNGEQEAAGMKALSADYMEPLLTHLAGLIEDKLNSIDESEKLAQELAKSFEDLNLYSKVTTQIKTVRFSPNKLEELVRDILESMRAQTAFTMLPERSEYNTLVTDGEVDGRLTDHSDFTKALIDAIPPEAPSLVDDYFIVNNSSLVPGYQHLHKDPFRFLGVRIRHGGIFYGWLGMVSFNLEEIFRRGEMSLLTSVSEQVALVISNSDLYQDLEAMVINVGKSLVSAIEAKDPYTSGHSERVNLYSMLTANYLDLDEEQKKDLNWASVLHDIGKIGIPESILNKPGKLDGAEYAIIRGHPQKGYNILKPLEQLKASLPGIIHHHERYDGSGYPRGLKGEEIPLVARIIAVSDTFDAITSDRAYRAAKSGQEALQEMQRVAGSQLDPDIVEVFKTMYAKHLAHQERA